MINDKVTNKVIDENTLLTETVRPNGNAYVEVTTLVDEDNNGEENTVTSTRFILKGNPYQKGIADMLQTHAWRLNNLTTLDYDRQMY